MKTATTMGWIRAAGTRLHTGSSRLATHYAARTAQSVQRRYAAVRAWLASSSGLTWLTKAALLVAAAGLLRKIATKAGGGFYERLHTGAAAWLLWPAAALWIIAAYRAGHPDWKPKQPPAAPEQNPAADAQEQQAEPADTLPPAGPRPISPIELVAAVRDVGTPNAQLVPLAAHLRTTTDAIKAAAADVGWRVKDVRMEGRSTSAGLRWDEAPTPVQAYPDPDVVGAGQPANDNDDDSDGEGPREGLRVQNIGEGGRLIHDPATTIRHHTVRGT
ncbi:hypothetical protein [Streptomyces fructofermentans]|uniref:Uncharacterized protein n=1 Tax=Streptomyces fructofermentans TaxID=152141 RepID=A0A918NVP3_9ACTN|nr:hypothetical protein [Streptomyces fructofermentans]GGX99236.1 hypothetical protein GCM10010515_76780 [Streptomyces fructofermentans]